MRATGLYAQFTVGTLGHNRDLTTLEGGLMFALIPGIVLHLGYRTWEYIENHDDRSDVDIILRGPMIALRFEY